MVKNVVHINFDTTQRPRLQPAYTPTTELFTLLIDGTPLLSGLEPQGNDEGVATPQS